jgi:hypothetical protein
VDFLQELLFQVGVDRVTALLYTAKELSDAVGMSGFNDWKIDEDNGNILHISLTGKWINTGIQASKVERNEGDYIWKTPGYGEN